MAVPACDPEDIARLEARRVVEAVVCARRATDAKALRARRADMFVVEEEGNGESIMLPGQTGINDVIVRPLKSGGPSARLLPMYATTHIKMRLTRTD